MTLGGSWQLVFNTLLLVGATEAICLPAGVLMGWLLARTDLPGRRGFAVLLGGMLLVPLYLQAAAWEAGFGLQGFGPTVWKTPAFLTGWWGAIWVHAVAALPWVVLIAGSGFRLVEPELEEQALLDTSAARTFWLVTLPSAFPAVGVAALWVAILVAGEMAVTDLFTVRTYAEEVYTRTAVADEFGQPTLEAIPGVVLSAGLVLAGVMLSAGLSGSRRPAGRRARWVFSLSAGRWPLAFGMGVVVLVLIGIPLGNLLYQVGGVVIQTDSGRVRSWSLLKALTLTVQSPVRFRRELVTSFEIALVSASLAVAAGAVLAWLVRASRWRGAPVVVLSLTAVGMALPGPILGLAMIWALDRPGVPGLVYLYDRTLLAPWLAMALRGLGPATLILWHAWRTIPQELLDSAAVDGAGRWGQFWRIAAPNRLVALGLAWLVAAVVSLGDLAASILVTPPGMQTLSIHLFGLLHAGVEDRVAAICLAQVALLACLAGVMFRLADRWRRMVV